MTRPLRFHVNSLPHLPVSKTYNACAYTSKLHGFCRMMRSLGHHVTLYGAEGTDVSICDEFVQVASTAELEEWFGVYDWRSKTFNLKWEPQLDHWKITNLRTAAEVLRRCRKGDIVTVVGGTCHKPMTDQLDQTKVAVVEPFVGYGGVYAEYQVYESQTHLTANAHLTGLNNNGNPRDPNGSNYWDVVPVYFDPDDFPEGKGDGGYYVYLGRLTIRKGIRTAENVCRAMGAKLLIAGQGVKSWDAENHILETEEGERFEGPHIEYVGYADVKKRAELLGGAIAAFTPTTYFEPGGNTSVEPQACGTPVLSSNFGCFTQQVFNGVTGYRPTTLQEWMICAEACKSLDRKKIREIAHARFSLNVVRHLYDQYFQRVYDRYMGSGWATIDPERKTFYHYV